ncbi:MAG: hypothetical protein ACI358_06230 [Candidatus Limimorpha sp.]
MMLMIKSFAMPEVWNTLIQFSIIALGILVGNILRTKVPFLQKSLIPSALLGGALILLFKALPGMGELVNKTFMEIITYHALGLGFVALALKNNSIESKSSTMTVIETGALTANTYIIQGIAGLLVTIPFFYFGHKIFYASGLLLPMGYAQGPGQALNFGVIFTNFAENQGIAFSGADFGLSIAATGFIVGSVVGVVFLNILSKSGKIKISKIKEKQVNTIDDYEGENEIPDTESVDKMSIQICLVLFTYFLVFLFCNFIEGLDLGEFGEKTLKPLLWGFNFLIGTLFGVIVKWALHGFRKAKIVKREYINNYLLNRISGFAFDVMIVAGTAAINFNELNEFAIPFIFVCVVGAVFTFTYVLAVCKHIYPGYPYEGFFSMFGMLTGTASNGMILLREIDPKFETPAANNLVLQLLPASILGLPILILMGFAPRSLIHTIITLGILIVLFVVFSLFLFRKKIFKRKYSKQ